MEKETLVEVEPERAEIYELPSPWARLLAMIILGVCFGAAQSVMFLVAFVQFAWSVVDRQPNENLLSFGKALSTWLHDTAKFLTFVSEDRPFPWAKWPDDK